jgi:hypothetical protein
VWGIPKTLAKKTRVDIVGYGIENRAKKLQDGQLFISESLAFIDSIVTGSEGRQSRTASATSTAVRRHVTSRPSTRRRRASGTGDV